MSHAWKPDVSILIQAFNEGDVIEDVVRDVVDEFAGDRFEIIVIDDGSTDGTAEAASRFPVQVVAHRRNRGYGAALKTGLRHARGDVVAFMDSDSQHSAQHLGAVVERFSAGDDDMVIGVRSGVVQSTLLRAPGKFLIRKTAEYLVRENVPDINSGMRALRRRDALRFSPICPDGFSMSSTLTMAFLCERMNIGYVNISTQKRVGASTVKWKDGLRALFGVISLMVLFRPFRVFFPLSLILGILGITFGIYGVIVTGKVPNTSIVLMLGALISFCFGFLAEQVSLLRRILVDLREPPEVEKIRPVDQRQRSDDYPGEE